MEKDILKRKKEIHDLVATDNIPEAIKRAMDYVDDFTEGRHPSKHSILIISSNYHQLIKDYKACEIDLDEKNRGRTKTLNQMLTLLDDVEEQYGNAPNAA